MQLDGATRQTQALSQHLAKSSSAQSRQIAAATESIAAMAGSIEEVSGNAERAADVARHSVDIAHKGGEAVRRTIDGMNTIRETIQETSKRIKRLGESSQEIGNIVELINDLAEQTNILALNASIQASMAGEAGRGFAVVADEVQRLAERAANATKQIDALVRTIQADTNGAVVSMERSTTDVVGGAQLAENAGAALEKIEQVSNQIASLVQNISASARSQSQSGAERGAQHAGAARDQLADRRCHQQHLRGHREAGAAVGGAAQVGGRLPPAGRRPQPRACIARMTAPDPDGQGAGTVRRVGWAEWLSWPRTIATRSPARRWMPSLAKSRSRWARRAPRSKPMSSSPTTSTLLHRCRAELAQVQGVLRVMEIHGAALLAEEMHQVARYLQATAGEQKNQAEALDALMRAMVQLPGYLDRVLAGGRDLALVLLPLLNDMRAVRGSPLLSEGTLLLLNLKSEKQAAPQAPSPGEEGMSVAQWARRSRSRFQLGLIGWIRGERVEQHLETLASVATRFEQVATTQPLFQLWWVVGAVIEALRERGLEGSVSIKRLLGLADREIEAAVRAWASRAMRSIRRSSC